VEGWIPASELEQAVAFFNKQNYRLIVTTGEPRETEFCLPEYKTFAELTAAILRKLGVRENLIVSVPTPPVRADRTYAYSLGTHARRTQLLFQDAIGDNIAVGVIAASSPEYDADNWWAWSSGVRAVVGELVAYLYARFLFTPDERETVPG
jgi:hypothetical protein